MVDFALSTEGIFAPWGILGHVWGTFFGCHNLGEGAIGIWWVEAKDLINVYTARTASPPPAKGYPAPYIDSGEVKKCWCTLKSIFFFCGRAKRAARWINVDSYPPGSVFLSHKPEILPNPPSHRGFHTHLKDPSFFFKASLKSVKRVKKGSRQSGQTHPSSLFETWSWLLARSLCGVQSCTHATPWRVTDFPEGWGCIRRIQVSHIVLHNPADCLILFVTHEYLGWPRVQVCLKQSGRALLVLRWLKVVPPFTIKSVLVWRVDYMATLLLVGREVYWWHIHPVLKGSCTVSDTSLKTAPQGRGM